MLVSAGLLGGVGQILLTSSYRWADASVVAPFDYVSMLFALLFGYFVLRRSADPDDAGRGGAGRDGGHPHHLARTATGPEAGAATQGDDTAGLTVTKARLGPVSPASPIDRTRQVAMLGQDRPTPRTSEEKTERNAPG